MKKALITVVGVVLLAAFGMSAWAADFVDVVYLKNGSIIRGQIVEQIPNESIKIMTADGSVFVFKMSEIERITKEPASAAGIGGARPMKAFNFVVNPLGFIQFGPMMQLELRFMPGLYGVLHTRLHGLGLLSHYLFEADPSYYSFAVGPGLRYFFISKQLPHAPYVGFITEFGYEPYTGDVGTIYEWAGTSLFLTFAANGGYRWRFGSFLVEVGAYAGLSPTIRDEWYYISDPSVKISGGNEVVFFGMLEVSIGWEF